VVSGRDAGRPEEQAHLSLGQNWLTEKLMSSDPSQGEAASVLYDLMPAHNPAYLSDI
jgi:hypothetical protein